MQRRNDGLNLGTGSALQDREMKTPA